MHGERRRELDRYLPGLMSVTTAEKRAQLKKKISREAQWGRLYILLGDDEATIDACEAILVFDLTW